MSYLELKSLTKDYGDHRAVDDVSLAIEKGEFISLLGPSGCGKTTTLQMIAGFVSPSCGAIRLEGRDLISVPPHQRGLGIVFQSYALFPHMTVSENVAFGLEMRGIGKQERVERVREILDLVGLSARADRFPREMSGGQQQRVALARALVIKPGILLLDEPLSNLDAKLREGMQLELRQIQRKLGTTTVLVTHDQAEAMALSDRVVVMNNGRIEQIGTPEETYECPATVFVANFLGRANALASRDGESVFVRPEKISIVAAGSGELDATVTLRVFQGSQWLYELQSEQGVVTAILQNDGRRHPDQGERVGLIWSARHEFAMQKETAT